MGTDGSSRPARGSLLARLSRRFGAGRVRFLRAGLVYVGVMAFLFFGSLMGRANLLMLLFAMMAGLFVLNGWAIVLLLGKVSVVRRLPEYAFAGALFSVELEARNRKRRMSSWALVARDRVRAAERNGDVFEPGVLFARVPGRSSRRGHYRGVLARRGRYRFGPIRLATRFPLGLVERAAYVESYDELVVYPRLGQLAPGWRRRWAELHQEAAQARRTVLPEELHGLRDFLPGDSTRLIHWRTSARTGELKVREFEQYREQGMAVLVDLYVPPGDGAPGDGRREGAGSVVAGGAGASYAHEQPAVDGSSGTNGREASAGSRDALGRVGGRAPVEALESAISFAATLCAQSCGRGGSRIVLGLAGDEVAVYEGPASRGFLHELLGVLAEARGSPASDPETLVRAAAGRIGARQSVVLVSPRRLQIDDAVLDGGERVEGARVTGGSRARGSESVLRGGRRRRSLRGRLLVIDSSSSAFGQVFRVSGGGA